MWGHTFIRRGNYGFKVVVCSASRIRFKSGTSHPRHYQGAALPGLQDIPSWRDERPELPYTHLNGPDYIIPTNDTMSWDRDGAIQIRPPKSGTETLNARFPAVSVPSAFRRMAELIPDNVALAVKRNGQWKTWTYQQYYQESRTVAKAFIKLGLKRHQTVAILGFNAPEWFMSEMGAIMAGGIATGIYTTSSPEMVQYILKDSEANICVVDDAAQLEKITQIRDSLPELKAVVQYTGNPERPDVLSWRELLNVGQHTSDDVLEARLKGIAINNPCLVMYTSGTTGCPKGAMVTHDNILYAVWHPIVHTVKITDIGKERVISYLPLSHLLGQALDVFSGIVIGASVYFAQPDAFKGSLAETLKEARPTLFMSVPRVWEKLTDRIRAAESELSPMKKILMSWARSVSYKHNMSKMKGKPVKETLSFKIAKALVLDKILQKVGLDAAWRVMSSAAPLSKSTLDYLHSINLPILEGYGMTECTGGHTFSTIEKFKIGSVGFTMEMAETKVADPDPDGNGELLLRGRHIFMGYLNMEEQTKEALDSEGWLRSGDIGHIDENGFVYITGRIKELIITAGGENVPPVPIEDKIKATLPVVSNVMIVGDKRRFLSALITIKTDLDSDGAPLDTLSPESLSWCASIGSSAKTIEEFINDPKCHNAIRKKMETVNDKAVSNVQKIRKWAVLEKDFSVGTGEIGPTLKLKRHYVHKKYRHIIDRFYVE